MLMRMLYTLALALSLLLPGVASALDLQDAACTGNLLLYVETVFSGL